MTGLDGRPSLVLRQRRPGGDPVSWLPETLAARRAEWDEPFVSPVRSASLAEVLAHSGALLAHQHQALVADGVPPKAAATYLAGWFGGGLAESIGVGLAGAGAAFCADADQVRFDLHAEGWPQEVRPGGAIVVDASHPWAGRPGVEVVEDPFAVLDRAVRSLVQVATPIIDACRALAPVGRVGLWNEVGDALACVLSYQSFLPADATALVVLDAAVSWPGPPWKARPRLGFAASELLGPVAVAQKGGCCLAYTRDRSCDDHHGGDGEPDPEQVARDDRFPDHPAQPSYCSTCSFRDPADCDARQVLWRERHTARAST